MYRTGYHTLWALLLLLVLLPARTLATEQDDGFQNRLKHQLETFLDQARQQEDVLRGSKLSSIEAVNRLYRNHEAGAVWFRNQRLTREALELIWFIDRADRHALDPERYHLTRLRQLSATLPNTVSADGALSRTAELELLLTDAFLSLSLHLREGRFSPNDLHEVRLDSADHHALRQQLEQALLEGQPLETLESLAPEHQDYRQMMQALQEYRRIRDRGGWPVIDAQDLHLEPGDRHRQVPQIRKRLQITGDLPDSRDAGQAQHRSTVFDEQLSEAVRRFQERHGLREDSVIGQATLQELNVPVEQRLKQIKASMERMRWLPDELGDRHIKVNIAGFQVSIVDHGRTLLTMRAVVGQQYRETPVFSSEINHMIFSPHWFIPRTIAQEDILPRVRNDPSYLDQQGIRVFDRNTGTEVDPAQVDWNSVSASSMNYRFQQEPGPRNEMGGVKFMLPNEHSIYLHDTPHRHLFWQQERTYSSGCIRIAKPLDLAEYLLRDEGEWGFISIMNLMDRGHPYRINLNNPVPVHLVYFTSWVNERGQTHFRGDVYGRDADLHEAIGRLAGR